MKRFTICAVATLLICSFGLQAAAAETQPAELENQVVVSAQGEVRMSPALITVTVPTRIDFSIDPSKPEDDMFQSATGKITVDCGYDLKMDLLGIKAADGTTAKVVAQDKFENWNDLSQEDTVSHIALGIRKPILAAIWSKPEEGNLLNTSCGSYTLDDGDHSINLVAKYGRMWPENTTLQYNVYLRFSLAE